MNDNVYLRDVANVSFSDSDTTSYARQNSQPVVMLDVKKERERILLMLLTSSRLRLKS